MFVFIPKIKSRPENGKYLDFPYGKPAMVHYLGRVETYGKLCDEELMKLEPSPIRLSERQLNWLHSIKPAVESCLERQSRHQE